MYDVALVAPSQGPVHDFRSIAMGSADANFEVWQAGKEEQVSQWVRNGKAIVANHHQVPGVSGIYTLTHTVERFPGAQFYQNLANLSLPWMAAGQRSTAGEPAADPTGIVV